MSEKPTVLLFKPPMEVVEQLVKSGYKVIITERPVNELLKPPAGASACLVECDFCEDRGDNMSCFEGWRWCSSDRCRELARLSRSAFTKKIDGVFKDENNIRVKRSNGDVEDGWAIYTKAFRFSVDDPFKFGVHKNGSTKGVRLEETILLNQD